jgi:lipopolysaccharide export system permease protein
LFWEKPEFILIFMKLLYRYILREHIGPFFFGLFVITFILVMDFILEIVNLIIGKGLNAFTILQIFVLNLAWMFALSIPMAVLVAVLMAFGRLSQDNEITAMKSAGVSLYKMLLPPLFASLVIAGGLVWFNNKVLPEANHKERILRSAIHQKRPTLALKENVFIDYIPDYSILIKKVNPKTSELSEITIYDQKERKIPRTIIAQRGNLEFSPDGNTLILHLFDGEIHEVDQNEPNKYRRIAFDKQVIYIADAGNQLVKIESNYRTDREMNSKMMLNQVRDYKNGIKSASQSMSSFLKPVLGEVLFGKNSNPGRIFEQILSSTRKKGIEVAIRRNESILNQLYIEREKINTQKKEMNSLLTEVHKKYSIPVACIVFVLIGIPLGIMAKKGGIAVGLGLSVGFFLLYWAFLIAGEELADRMYISAFAGMWSANIVIGMAGLYILVRSAKEIRFISWEWTKKFIPKRARKLA